MIPTRQMCEQLWNDKGLGGDLREHMTAVAGLAARIGMALNQKGFSLNIPLIEAAALLHDIEKGTPHHDMAGAQTLEKLGFGEIAPIVRAHMRLPEEFRPEISERTVVFLADKLFIGSKAVTSEDRYAEKMHAYRERPIVYRMVRNQRRLALCLEKQIKDILRVDSLFRLL